MKRAILLTAVLIATFGLSGCSYNDLTAKQQNVNAAWTKVESDLVAADLFKPLEAARWPASRNRRHSGVDADARSRLLDASKSGDGVPRR